MADPFDSTSVALQTGPARASETIVFTGGNWDAVANDCWRAVVAVGAGVIKGYLIDDPPVDRLLPIGAYDEKGYRLKHITESGTTATGLVRLK